MEAPDLLEKAAQTMRERSVERDTEKERAMSRTVQMFNAAFGTRMTEYEGWVFMLFLKMARAHGGSFREDDYLDMAAYAALAGECRAKPGLEFLQMMRDAKFDSQVDPQK